MYHFSFPDIKNSPHDDDDKVQHVPAVSDVGVLVHDQTIGNDLQKCLYCENDQEGIFYFFLHRVKGCSKIQKEGEEKRKQKFFSETFNLFWDK